MEASSVFQYELPPDRIAQRPLLPYDQARLLIINRAQKSISESRFCDLPNLLGSQDLLVFNKSRVIPARLFGELEGGGQFEVLLLKQVEINQWRCLGKPLRKLKSGARIHFGSNLFAQLELRVSDTEVLLRFGGGAQGEDLTQSIYAKGVMPIPPYIRHGQADLQDVKDYQAHFAEIEGSIAAPTASLHFTPKVLEELARSGCSQEFLTLHVGLGSIQPIIRDSQIQAPTSESYVNDPALIARLRTQREKDRRIVAVGTTVVRALESMCVSAEFETSLFIRPGFAFQMVEALITNFHQPGSSHLLLVEALLGRDLLEQAYTYALEHDFRFLSYGDGMYIF